MKLVAILVSGGGTNLQALIDASARGEMPSVKLSLVVTSKPGVKALERAEKAGIPVCVVCKKDFGSPEEFDVALLKTLTENEIDVVVLAGYLIILGDKVLSAYRGRILNIHPSLIPSFCGDGYYGLRVHKAALERGVKITGATVHLVNEITDGGRIILQKAIEVDEDDTPESLQKRVMKQCEWEMLPKAVEMVCSGQLEIRSEE